VWFLSLRREAPAIIGVYVHLLGGLELEGGDLQKFFCEPGNKNEMI
jgi:hypothetical protein